MKIFQFSVAQISVVSFLFVVTISSSFIQKEKSMIASIEEGEFGIETGIPEVSLGGNFFQNKFTKWISPDTLWSSLEFPIVPNSEESIALLTFEDPDPTVVDVSEYNLGLYDGLINGTLACDCGRPIGKIVNGKRANINNIPWTSALVYKDAEQPFCGATIINNMYLLTAGHCIGRTKADEIQVWLNDEKFLLTNDTSGGRLVYDVVEIRKHPQYKAYFNDIALLKLNETLKLGSREEFALVNPVCLPVDNDISYAGNFGTVAGWGTTSAGGRVSASLLKTNVPIWSNEECRRDSKYGDSVRDNMMCAGFKKGGTDACQGDSGGPLIVRQNNTAVDFDDDDIEAKAVLVGIVSWGFGCAEPRAPGVYTRVSVYIKWILDNTRDAQFCHVPSSL